MTTPIVDFVRQYAQSGTARLHMPGHKGQSLLGCEPWDITEIRGADELYEAEGIIAQSEANATRLFGTTHTYYSAEGSSQCIRAMLCLAMQGAPRTGKRPVLLAARNAHKALLYAAALLDFDIRWLWPAPEDTGALCSCPVTVQALSAALEELAGQGRTPFGVYLTSPDYLGGMQDIAALSAVCDAHGVPGNRWKAAGCRHRETAGSDKTGWWSRTAPARCARYFPPARGPWGPDAGRLPR